jgi:xylan 1,4-beta-xylosidase
VAIIKQSSGLEIRCRGNNQEMLGLLNIYGIPKPAFRTYQLLHRLGNELLKVSGEHYTVNVWIVRKKDNINIMITNWALTFHP